MAVDPTTRAVNALLATLRDQLPAALAAADAERSPRIVCARGPYEITAQTRTLEIDDSEVDLTIGAARIASDLAVELGGALGPVAAGADVDGRLVLTGANPSSGASRIRVGAGSANRALGLFAQVSSVVRIALAASPPVLLPHAIPAALVPDRLTIAVDTIRAAGPRPVKGGIWPITIGLLLVVPGSSADVESTLEAARAAAGCVKAVVRAGDGRGRNRVGGLAEGDGILDCLHVRTVAPVALKRTQNEIDKYFGVTAEEFTVRVYATDV